MPGDPFRKVVSGEKFVTLPAEAWNGFIDAYLDLRQRRHNQAAPRGAVQYGADIIKVRNDSGGDVDRFGVLGIDEPLILPADDLEAFQERVAVSGITPTTAAHQGKFVILLEPLAAGETGDAWAAGVAIVKLSVASTTDQFADVKNSDSTMLATGSSGAAQIEWKEPGTGTKWGVVRFGGAAESAAVVRFKLTAPLTLGGSAAAVIRKWDPTAGGGSGAYVDGDTITVKDYFGALGDPGEWQAPNGYYGYAVKLADLAEYQILYMEHQAEFVAFTLTADMSGGSAAATFNTFWTGRSTGGATAVYDRQSLYASAKNGDKGIACWDAKLERYQIIDMGKAASSDPVLFYLNADLAQGGNASATIRQWGGAAWAATGANVTVYDSSNLGPAATSKVGVCFLSSQSGRYEVIALPPSPTTVRFELTAGLPWGGSATANTLTWTGSSYVTGPSITVNDFTTEGAFSGLPGMRGVAELIEGVYEIVSLQQIARRVEWSAVQQMAKSETATVVNATLFYDGVAPIAVPGLLQVFNSRNIFQCDYSTKGVAVYKPELALYEIDWGTCASGVKPSAPVTPDTGINTLAPGYQEPANQLPDISVGGSMFAAPGAF